MRPAVFQVGGTLYWVIQTRNPDTMLLKDADSTPTVAVRKNGSSVGDSVTITKRTATTGIYDCSYNPAGEVEGDSFTVEESATVTGTTTSSATYTQAWNARVIAVERGTDSANTTTPPTAGAVADAVWDEARSGHVTTGTFGEKVNAELDSAVRVKLDATQPDYVPATATSLAAAKAILDKIDSGLVADGLVYQFTANMLELGPAGSGGSSDWTADERTAIRSILGIPGSGTTPANPTTGILDTIRDLVVAYIAAALATVDGSSGTIVDFPTSLNIGDSYTDEANASIHVFIRDASDDPITAVGSFNFTDPEFAPEVNITQSGSTGRVKAVVTFVEASPEDYLKVEIPSSQSRRASPGTATIQCLLKWVDTDGKVLCQKTLSKQAVTWNEMV